MNENTEATEAQAAPAPTFAQLVATQFMAPFTMKAADGSDVLRDFPGRDARTLCSYGAGTQYVMGLLGGIMPQAKAAAKVCAKAERFEQPGYIEAYATGSHLPAAKYGKWRIVAERADDEVWACIALQHELVREFNRRREYIAAKQAEWAAEAEENKRRHEETAAVVGEIANNLAAEKTTLELLRNMGPLGGGGMYRYPDIETLTTPPEAAA